MTRFCKPPKQRCVDLTAPQVAFLEHYSERRPATCPQESFVFPTCSGGGARPLPDTPAQTVERGWRQAMPRAEPALSRATLPLPAVIGAATLRGRQSPHP